MGIDKIEISTLTGKLQAQANVVDDGNGILEGKEIELFQNAAKAAGLAESEDYKAIFGADIKAAPASTTPVVLSKKETKTKQNAVKDFTKTLVKGKVRPENLMTELKKQFPEAKYSPMLKDVEYVLGLVTKAVKESKETDPKKAIEKIDSLILKPVYEYLVSTGEAFRIMVLPDHPTPIEIRTHSMESVPFFIFDSENERLGLDLFCEKDAEEASNYVSDGSTLLNILTSETIGD